MDTSEIKLKVLSQADWQIYKALRLASLLESPDAFGSTYEQEAQYSDEEWQSRLDPAGRAARALPLTAYTNGSPAGLVWAVVHDADIKVAHVYQLWVATEFRGLGIGRALMNRIIAWAEASQLKSLALAVTATHPAAIAFYRACGFMPSGELEELRPGSALRAQPMSLALCTKIKKG